MARTKQTARRNEGLVSGSVVSVVSVRSVMGIVFGEFGEKCLDLFTVKLRFMDRKDILKNVGFGVSVEKKGEVGEEREGKKEKSIGGFCDGMEELSGGDWEVYLWVGNRKTGAHIEISESMNFKELGERMYQVQLCGEEMEYDEAERVFSSLTPADFVLCKSSKMTDKAYKRLTTKLQGLESKEATRGDKRSSSSGAILRRDSAFDSIGSMYETALALREERRKSLESKKVDEVRKRKREEKDDLEILIQAKEERKTILLRRLREFQGVICRIDSFEQTTDANFEDRKEIDVKEAKKNVSKIKANVDSAIEEIRKESMELLSLSKKLELRKSRLEVLESIYEEGTIVVARNEVAPMTRPSTSGTNNLRSKENREEEIEAYEVFETPPNSPEIGEQENESRRSNDKRESDGKEEVSFGDEVCEEEDDIDLSLGENLLGSDLVETLNDFPADFSD